MHKIIHSKFEFDLSSYSISVVEENYWFSSQFFTKYSFPFTFELKDDLVDVFGSLLDDNSKFIETLYDVKYVIGNKIETAIFEIESQIGTRITCTFRYGFDELPNFDKKLADLPLEVKYISNMYNHAATIVNQKWPAVNYNFPQIHTEKYDTKTDTWKHFKGIINNYYAAQFPPNTFLSGVLKNINIVQPYPYLLHILKQGFLDAGYTLKGDVLNDETLKKIIVFNTKEDFIESGNFTTHIYKGVYSIFKGYGAGGIRQMRFNKTTNLLPNKEYRISGEIAIYHLKKNYNKTYIRLNGIVLAEIKASDSYSDIGSNKKQVSVVVNTSSVASQVLEFISDGLENQVISNNEIFNIKVENISDTAITQIKFKDEINLKKIVPDVTFGYLISELKKYLNIELVVYKKDIFMNFVNEEIHYENAIDLALFQTPEPKRKFNKLDSFLLKFKDPVNETVNFSPVHHTKKGIYLDEKLVDPKTTKITINILPLAHITKNGVSTAFAYSNSDSDLFFLLYDGIQTSGRNTTIDNTKISMPQVHAKYHQKWLNFRLKAITYRWNFKMYLENLAAIKKKVFAYGRFHIVKNIDKKQISEELFEVQIETETLE